MKLIKLHLLTKGANIQQGRKHLPKMEQLPSLGTLALFGLTSIEYESSGGPGGNELDDDESLISSSSSSFSSSSSRGGGGGGRLEPTPTTTFFPSLKYLYLGNMPNLKGWWRMSKLAETEEDEGQSTANINQEEQPQPQPLLSLRPSFPCLLESGVEKCPKLTSMPLQSTVVKLCLCEVSEKVVQPQLLMMMMMMAATPAPTTTPISMTKTTTVASTPSSCSLVPLSNLEKLMIWEIEDLVVVPEAQKFKNKTSHTQIHRDLRGSAIAYVHGGSGFNIGEKITNTLIFLSSLTLSVYTLLHTLTCSDFYT